MIIHVFFYFEKKEGKPMSLYFTDWKKEIRHLAKEFCIPKSVYNLIIKDVEKKWGNEPVPKEYKSRNMMMYQIAHRKLKSYLMDVL